jgi:bacterioferritin-associated ferredoxin
VDTIQICPNCGFPAILVNDKAVKFNLNDIAKEKFEPNLKWSICNNPHCNCSYFSKKQVFTLNNLIKPLFFKDDRDNVPICYCSDLTRGEIKNAVKHGMKTIDEVQNFTQKNITGFCEERNPLGKCCRNVFLKTIKEIYENVSEN